MKILKDEGEIVLTHTAELLLDSLQSQPDLPAMQVNPNPTPADVLVRLRQHIQERWCQGQLIARSSMGGVKVCLLGGLLLAMADLRGATMGWHVRVSIEESLLFRRCLALLAAELAEEGRIPDRVACEEWAERERCWHQLVQYNNHSARTQREVLDLIDRALERQVACKSRLA
jgi:hypothetical protein